MSTDLDAELEAFERIEAFKVACESVFGPVKLTIQRLQPGETFDELDARLERDQKERERAERDAKRRAYYRDRNRQEG